MNKPIKIPAGTTLNWTLTIAGGFLALTKCCNHIVPILAVLFKRSGHQPVLAHMRVMQFPRFPFGGLVSPSF